MGPSGPAYRDHCSYLLVAFSHVYRAFGKTNKAAHLRTKGKSRHEAKVCCGSGLQEAYGAAALTRFPYEAGGAGGARVIETSPFFGVVFWFGAGPAAT